MVRDDEIGLVGLPLSIQMTSIKATCCGVQQAPAGTYYYAEPLDILLAIFLAATKNPCVKRHKNVISGARENGGWMYWR